MNFGSLAAAWETSYTLIFFKSYIDVQKSLSGLRDTYPWRASIGVGAGDNDDDDEEDVKNENIRTTTTTMILSFRVLKK